MTIIICLLNRTCDKPNTNSGAYKIATVRLEKANDSQISIVNNGSIDSANGNGKLALKSYKTTSEARFNKLSFRTANDNYKINIKYERQQNIELNFAQFEPDEEKTINDYLNVNSIVKVNGQDTQLSSLTYDSGSSTYKISKLINIKRINFNNPDLLIFYNGK